jgi:hypothetical protein
MQELLVERFFASCFLAEPKRLCAPFWPVCFLVRDQKSEKVSAKIAGYLSLALSSQFQLNCGVSHVTWPAAVDNRHVI